MKEYKEAVAKRDGIHETIEKQIKVLSAELKKDKKSEMHQLFKENILNTDILDEITTVAESIEDEVKKKQYVHDALSNYIASLDSKKIDEAYVKSVLDHHGVKNVLDIMKSMKSLMASVRTNSAEEKRNQQIVKGYEQFSIIFFLVKCVLTKKRLFPKRIYSIHLSIQ